METFFIISIIVILIIILFNSIKNVKQNEVYIIERFNKYSRTEKTGTIFLFPFIDKVKQIVNLETRKEIVTPEDIKRDFNLDLPLTIEVYYKITDPAKSVYTIDDNSSLAIYLLICGSIADVKDKINTISLSNLISLTEKYLNDSLIYTGNEFGFSIENINIYETIEPSTTINNNIDSSIQYF